MKQNKKRKVEAPRFMLFDLDGWQEIWQTISQNKMRSMLTAFGVFWGIFMLIVMVGFGTGIQNATLGTMKHISANSTFLFTENTTEPYMGFKKGRAWQLTNDDEMALLRNFPDIKYISKVIFSRQENTNNAVRGDKSGSYQMIGFSPEFNKIAPVRVLQGRYLNDLDIQEARKVVVIGERVVNDLFGSGENPIGQLIRVQGIYYQVIGVVTPMNSNMNFFGPADEQLILPVTTLQRSQNLGIQIDGLAISANDDVDIEQLENEIHADVKRRHIIAPTDKKAINSFNLKRFFSLFQVLVLGINALIWIVGLGTLLAGLVGVSNIMLVTVRERTQEIGVRRALGATPKLILTQVLCESLVLTLLAGTAGMSAGIGVLAVLTQFFPAGSDTSLLADPQISFGTAMLALFILIISGLAAGALPASRAIQIKAIEALRDE